MHNLENHLVSIKIKDIGAELCSLYEKHHDIEYIWYGDKSIWGRNAPVLFPIIGKVKDNAYKVNKKSYSLPQHGFARDCNFDLIEKTDTSLCFELLYSKETLKIYPFKFKLQIKYELIKNILEINYKVVNLDNDEIYFSLGAHPGFNCPLYPNENFDDYYLELEKHETLNTLCLNSEGYFNNKSKPFLMNENKISLNYDIFKEDALVFKNLKSESVTLKSTKNQRQVKVSFKDFPYLGIWTKGKDAPFVCIEPWYGHADFEDFTGEFKNKEGILKLNINEEFNAKMSIEVS